MRFNEVVAMGLDEYYEELHRAVDGLTLEERRFMPTPDSHHVDFAVWHIARVEDSWINWFAKERADQVWSAGDWWELLNMPAPRDRNGQGPDTGWGWTGDQIRQMPEFAMEDLWGYFDAVRTGTKRFLDSLDEHDLDRRPMPERAEYTIGRMWSHLLVEESQHVGQVSYLRGMQRGLNN